VLGSFEAPPEHQHHAGEVPASDFHRGSGLRLSLLDWWERLANLGDPADDVVNWPLRADGRQFGLERLVSGVKYLPGHGCDRPPPRLFGVFSQPSDGVIGYPHVQKPATVIEEAIDRARGF
jgi:hypothetical protein